MDRCPSCRARVKALPQCQRCGTELQWLRQIEKQARQRFIRSVNSFEQQALSRAIIEAEQAIQLVRLPLYIYWQRFLLAN